MNLRKINNQLVNMEAKVIKALLYKQSVRGGMSLQEYFNWRASCDEWNGEVLQREEVEEEINGTSAKSKHVQKLLDYLFKKNEAEFKYTVYQRYKSLQEEEMTNEGGIGFEDKGEEAESSFEAKAKARGKERRKNEAISPPSGESKGIQGERNDLKERNGKIGLKGRKREIIFSKVSKQEEELMKDGNDIDDNANPTIAAKPNDEDNEKKIIHSLQKKNEIEAGGRAETELLEKDKQNEEKDTLFSKEKMEHSEKGNDLSPIRKSNERQRGVILNGKEQKDVLINKVPANSGLKSNKTAYSHEGQKESQNINESSSEIDKTPSESNKDSEEVISSIKKLDDNLEKTIPNSQQEKPYLRSFKTSSFEEEHVTTSSNLKVKLQFADTRNCNNVKDQEPKSSLKSQLSSNPLENSQGKCLNSKEDHNNQEMPELNDHLLSSTTTLKTSKIVSKEPIYKEAIRSNTLFGTNDKVESAYQLMDNKQEHFNKKEISEAHSNEAKLNEGLYYSSTKEVPSTNFSKDRLKRLPLNEKQTQRDITQIQSKENEEADQRATQAEGLHTNSLVNAPSLYSCSKGSSELFSITSSLKSLMKDNTPEKQHEGSMSNNQTLLLNKSKGDSLVDNKAMKPKAVNEEEEEHFNMEDSSLRRKSSKKEGRPDAHSFSKSSLSTIAANPLPTHLAFLKPSFNCLTKFDTARTVKSSSRKDPLFIREASKKEDNPLKERQQKAETLLNKHKENDTKQQFDLNSNELNERDSNTDRDNDKVNNAMSSTQQHIGFNSQTSSLLKSEENEAVSQKTTSISKLDRIAPLVKPTLNEFKASNKSNTNKTVVSPLSHQSDTIQKALSSKAVNQIPLAATSMRTSINPPSDSTTVKDIDQPKLNTDLNSNETVAIRKPLEGETNAFNSKQVSIENMLRLSNEHNSFMTNQLQLKQRQFRHSIKIYTDDNFNEKRCLSNPNVSITSASKRGGSKSEIVTTEPIKDFKSKQMSNNNERNSKPELILKDPFIFTFTNTTPTMKQDNPNVKNKHNQFPLQTTEEFSSTKATNGNCISLQQDSSKKRLSRNKDLTNDSPSKTYSVINTKRLSNEEIPQDLQLNQMPLFDFKDSPIRRKDITKENYPNSYRASLYSLSPNNYQRDSLHLPTSSGLRGVEAVNALRQMKHRLQSEPWLSINAPLLSHSHRNIYSKDFLNQMELMNEMFEAEDNASSSKRRTTLIRPPSIFESRLTNRVSFTEGNRKRSSLPFADLLQSNRKGRNSQLNALYLTEANAYTPSNSIPVFTDYTKYNCDPTRDYFFHLYKTYAYYNEYVQVIKEKIHKVSDMPREADVYSPQPRKSLLDEKMAVQLNKGYASSSRLFANSKCDEMSPIERRADGRNSMGRDRYVKELKRQLELCTKKKEECKQLCTDNRFFNEAKERIFNLIRKSQSDVSLNPIKDEVENESYHEEIKERRSDPPSFKDKKAVNEVKMKKDKLSRPLSNHFNKAQSKGMKINVNTDCPPEKDTFSMASRYTLTSVDQKPINKKPQTRNKANKLKANHTSDNRAQPHPTKSVSSKAKPTTKEPTPTRHQTDVHLARDRNYYGIAYEKFYNNE